MESPLSQQDQGRRKIKGAAAGFALRPWRSGDCPRPNSTLFEDLLSIMMIGEVLYLPGTGCRGRR